MLRTLTLGVRRVRTDRATVRRRAPALETAGVRRLAFAVVPTRVRVADGRRAGRFRRGPARQILNLGHGVGFVAAGRVERVIREFGEQQVPRRFRDHDVLGPGEFRYFRHGYEIPVCDMNNFSEARGTLIIYTYTHTFTRRV